MANPDDRCIGVLLGIFTEQLVDDARAFGSLAKHVGDGAAPVNPELPALVPFFSMSCPEEKKVKSSKAGSRARSLVVNTRQQAQQACQLANVAV